MLPPAVCQLSAVARRCGKRSERYAEPTGCCGQLTAEPSSRAAPKTANTGATAAASDATAIPAFWAARTDRELRRRSAAALPCRNPPSSPAAVSTAPSSA